MEYAYDTDYADDVKMYELVKYDDESEEWVCQGIYAEDYEKATLLAKVFNELYLQKKGKK